MRHWWHRLFHRDLHHRYCTCQVVAVIWIGRGSVEPGMPMSPDEVEVIFGGR